MWLNSGNCCQTNCSVNNKGWDVQFWTSQLSICIWCNISANTNGWIGVNRTYRRNFNCFCCWNSGDSVKLVIIRITLRCHTGNTDCVSNVISNCRNSYCCRGESRCGCCSCNIKNITNSVIGTTTHQFNGSEFTRRVDCNSCGCVLTSCWVGQGCVVKVLSRTSSVTISRTSCGDGQRIDRIQTMIVWSINCVRCSSSGGNNVCNSNTNSKIRINFFNCLFCGAVSVLINDNPTKKICIGISSRCFWIWRWVISVVLRIKFTYRRWEGELGTVVERRNSRCVSRIKNGQIINTILNASFIRNDVLNIIDIEVVCCWDSLERRQRSCSRWSVIGECTRIIIIVSYGELVCTCDTRNGKSSVETRITNRSCVISTGNINNLNFWSNRKIMRKFCGVFRCIWSPLSGTDET